MEKLNIAEILKDCPTGMELDSTLFEGLEFDCIVDNEYLPIRCRIKHPNGGYTVYNFTKYGCWLDTTFAKCVIFPKGKTTWEGFQRPFKDGDVVVSKRGDIHLLWTSDSSYCAYREYYNNKLDCTITTGVNVARLATSEEKQKLFKAIKEHGYKWNPETKTLEKLPEFKAGDVLVSTAGNIVLCSHIDDSQVVHFHCRLNPLGEFEIKNDIGVGKSFHCTLASDTEKQRLFDKLKSAGYKYNPQTNKLEKLIEPKFKVGDVIQDEDGYKVIITKVNVEDRYYTYQSMATKVIGSIIFNKQNSYELVPNKFDITTLKPFESKVLVRDTSSEKWYPAIWGLETVNDDYPYVIVGGGQYNCCIPYENNQHLLGTTNDCDDFYKTWE